MVAAETIYKDSPLHLMLITPTLMNRAWCLWELAVRKSSKNFTIPLESTLPQYSLGLKISGSFYQHMKATNEEDFGIIKDKILSVYGNMAAFDWEIQMILKACLGNIQVCKLSHVPRLETHLRVLTVSLGISASLRPGINSVYIIR